MAAQNKTSTETLTPIFLNQLQNITGLPMDEIALFASKLKSIKVIAGSLLLQENQVCNDIYFLQQGLLRAFLNVNEKQVNTEFFKEGEFAGAFTGYLLNKTTALNIEALEDSYLAVIPRQLMEEMYKNTPRWLAVGKFIFEKEFIKKCVRESSFLQDDAKQRYLKFTLNYPWAGQRIPLKHIASYLGIQPETLSRIRSGKL